MADFDPRIIVVDDETDVEPIRFTLKWSIKNLSSMQETKGFMYSTGTTMSELGMSKHYCGRWRIGVQPCPYVTDKYASVCLCLTDVDLKSDNYTGEHELRCHFRARITTGKFGEVPVFTSTGFSEHTFRYSRVSNYGDHNRVSRLKLSGADEETGLSKDDCLNIAVDVLLVNELGANGFSSAPKRHREFLVRQLKRLGDGTDFLLIAADGNEFPVERAFLMAHSPIFAAMLTHDSKEKQTSRCKMEDVDGESVEILLEYVYGCETEKISADNMEKVLIMADKYEILDLRAVCEAMLANSITVDNAARLLALARQRNLGMLKEMTMNFVRKNTQAFQEQSLVI